MSDVEDEMAAEDVPAEEEAAPEVRKLKPK